MIWNRPKPEPPPESKPQKMRMLEITGEKARILNLDRVEAVFHGTPGVLEFNFYTGRTLSMTFATNEQATARLQKCRDLMLSTNVR